MPKSTARSVSRRRKGSPVVGQICVAGRESILGGQFHVDWAVILGLFSKQFRDAVANCSHLHFE